VFLLLLLLLLRTCNRLQGQTLEAQRRREGSTLSIQCPYTAGITSQQTKYWCLLKDGQCQEIVNTYNNHRKYDYWKIKIEINDDSTSNTVSVTMTDLKAEESGTYFCAAYGGYKRYVQFWTISLNVFKAHILGVFQGPSSTQLRSQAASLCSENTFTILSVVLLILLLLALITSVALGVRHYRLLLRTGGREAEDTSDRPESTAQPGSTGRRESSQDDSKGPAYINLVVQSHPSPEDPLYCNVEPSQAHRTPQHVEYAVIAFNQSPRSSRE
ncbi:TREM1 protein, partial [Leptocoma aspasia]|nr:TREM1 protein [Leptocoma aspasia]